VWGTAVMDHITVPKVENVKLLDRYIGKKPANGSLYLTATHLIYVEASGAARKETWNEALRLTNHVLSSSALSVLMFSILQLNALANRAAGKGYENEDNYANIRFRFMSIENIHVMRSSLQKLLEVCELKTPTMSEFLSGLESSGWLRHIKAIMDAGIFIAKAVKVEKTNVLVHCSDGWDRTAQVCSVASILLDPFYRTFKGLMILIEKEWICMGHKFSQRCGHLDGDSKEVSPIFTQFLDCIWQLMEQFPCAFEFNENFLLEIHDHVFSCQFGNFLGNCQKDRDDLRIYEKTHSVWPFLVQRKPDFRNPLYKGFTVYGVLNPSTVPYNIQFWCGMYNRFDKGLQPKQSMLESLLEIKKQRSMLEADVHKLEKKLKAHDEPPEEVCTCSQLGHLLSQHLGTPLTNSVCFMGIDGDLNTLMENGTLSREGGPLVQMGQVKSQCTDLHHDYYGIMGNLRAINISRDVGFSGDKGISGVLGISNNMGTTEAMGFYEDISISETMSFSGNMGISEDIGLSKASNKTGFSKQQ
ncbi:hypothetical protein G4228_019234, partial [Cervus hanglu yarkandensis]